MWSRYLMCGCLLPAVLAGIGCSEPPTRQVGMVVIYEVWTEGTGLDSKPNKMDLQALSKAIDQRLNPGRRKSGSVRLLEDWRIEVSIFRADPAQMQRIADFLSRAGTLEFRIVANRRDHLEVISRAEAEPDSTQVRGADGAILAWWVPARDPHDKSLGEDVACRTVKRDTREVLVVKDPFDVTGADLKEVKLGVDEIGKPCVDFVLGADGAKRFEGLTAENLPDLDGGCFRQLGIVLDGTLHSAPRIVAAIGDRGRITGDFTRQEVQDIVDVLSAGSLPCPIRKVDQRIVAESR